MVTNTPRKQTAPRLMYCYITYLIYPPPQPITDVKEDDMQCTSIISYCVGAAYPHSPLRLVKSTSYSIPNDVRKIFIFSTISTAIIPLE